MVTQALNGDNNSENWTNLWKITKIWKATKSLKGDTNSERPQKLWKVHKNSAWSHQFWKVTLTLKGDKISERSQKTSKFWLKIHEYFVKRAERSEKDGIWFIAEAASSSSSTLNSKDGLWGEGGGEGDVKSCTQIKGKSVFVLGS